MVIYLLQFTGQTLFKITKTRSIIFKDDILQIDNKNKK